MNNTSTLDRPTVSGTRQSDRVVRAPRGSELTCRNWQIEAAYRMIQNNLDPEVAEKPSELIVYGGLGKAARNWECFDAILEALKGLEPDETLLVQSGKPVGIFRTHLDAPRVLIANSNLVPKWATWEEFRRLDELGLMMYGQMTAGSWIYIGTQGILQGTFETFAACAAAYFGASSIALFSSPCARINAPSARDCIPSAYQRCASGSCRTGASVAAYHTRPAAAAPASAAAAFFFPCAPTAISNHEAFHARSASIPFA